MVGKLGIDWNNKEAVSQYRKEHYHLPPKPKPDIISDEVKIWLVKAKPYQRETFFAMFDEHMQHLETLKSVDSDKYGVASREFRPRKWDKAHFGFLGRLYAKRERKKQAKKGNNGGVL